MSKIYFGVIGFGDGLAEDVAGDAVCNDFAGLLGAGDFCSLGFGDLASKLFGVLGELAGFELGVFCVGVFGDFVSLGEMVSITITPSSLGFLDVGDASEFLIELLLELLSCVCCLQFCKQYGLFCLNSALFKLKTSEILNNL